MYERSDKSFVPSGDRVFVQGLQHPRVPGAPLLKDQDSAVQREVHLGLGGYGGIGRFAAGAEAQ